MIRPCEISRNLKPKKKRGQQNKKGKWSSPESGLQEKEAIEGAQNCLSLRDCFSCELCSLLCPELCITRHEQTGQVQIDLDYCKGCGICSSICPKGAIKMVLDEGI